MYYNTHMNAGHILQELGKQIRGRRVRKGFSQQRLAELAGLSPRYISQLESGQGNISILRLYELGRVLGAPLHELVRLGDHRHIIAIVGLRGAGKSVVGAQLAAELGTTFVELDQLIEEEAGLRLAEIFALHGESYYRRLEHDVLSRFVATDKDSVLATGGSLVHGRATYELLKAHARTVWLKARPEQHLERVAAQGDQRPMAGRSDPLAELRTLLLEREPLYAEADVTVDTSALSPEDAVKKVIEKLERSTIGA